MREKLEDETEIDLGKLFRALLRRLPIILFVRSALEQLDFLMQNIIFHWNIQQVPICM